MQHARFRICALVGLACSVACSSSTDDGPSLESGGHTSTSAGSAAANGGHPSSNGGSGFAGTNSNGGVSHAGGASSGAGSGGVTTSGSSSGGTSGVSSGGKGSGGSSTGAVSSGGKGSGGSSAGGSGGKGSGGSSSGGSGSGGKGSSGGSSSGGSGSGGKGSGGAGGSSACPEVNTQLCGMTAQHNQARANVNPVPATPLPAMSWDATVAAAAQAWADQCNFSHNTAGYGQNLYASAGGGPPSASTVVTSWVSEVADYTYSSNVCSGTCGHYTQVVWRSSTLVGCGIKSCSTNTPFGAQFPNWYIVVCNYSPPGNNGSRPY